MPDTATADHVLSLQQRFQAPRQRVFEAFTSRDGLQAWFGPASTTARVHELDVRVGGNYTIDIVNTDGEAFRVSGIYRKIDPPKALEFTWIWGQGNYAGRETVVSLAFNDLGGETELRLTHSGLADAQAVHLHNEGWSSSMTALDRLVTGPTS